MDWLGRRACAQSRRATAPNSVFVAGASVRSMPCRKPRTHLRRSQPRVSGVRRRGPVVLVFVGPMVSHVELFWTMPEFKAFFEQLSTFCRIVLFDKAGLGLSDPVPQVRTLDDRAAEIEAVMDAVGFTRAALFALSEGGAASIVSAARRPERTRALILYGSYSYMPAGGWDNVDRDPAGVRARFLPGLGEDYPPSAEQLVRILEMGRAVYLPPKCFERHCLAQNRRTSRWQTFQSHTTGFTRRLPACTGGLLGTSDIAPLGGRPDAQARPLAAQERAWPGRCPRSSPRLRRRCPRAAQGLLADD